MIDLLILFGFLVALVIIVELASRAGIKDGKKMAEDLMKKHLDTYEKQD